MYIRRGAVLVLAILALSSCSRPTGRANDAPTTRARSAAKPRAIVGFERVLLLEDTAGTSANVDIGDLDGDGKLDIVLAKGRHWPVVDRVLFGDGRGHFPRAHDLGATADRSYSGRLSDLDRDGDLDAVISNDAPDPKLVYLNDGRGRFHAGSTVGQAQWPTRNATVADLNGDALPDIVLANRTGEAGGANYICVNRGNGRFDGDCFAFSTESSTTITAADFDRDSRMDLAVPHRDLGQSHIYVQDAHAPFPNFRKVPFGPADAAMRVSAAADFDTDGMTDLVAIDERRGVAIYFGQPAMTFSAGLPIGSGSAVPYALAVGDLNLDDAADVIVGFVEAPPAVYFNDGTGRRFTRVAFGDARGTAYGFAIGDLDGDGRPDIAVARSEAPNVVYFATPVAESR